MIDSLTSVRLMLSLVILVYGFLVSLSREVTPTAGTAAIAGLVPFFVWLFVPGLLETAAVGVPLAVRRASLLAGALAVALRYVAFRKQGASPALLTALNTGSLVVLVVAVGVGSANWLATTPVLISAVAVSRLRSSEGFSGGDRGRRPRQPDR